MNEIILEGEQADYIFNPFDKANFIGSGGMGKVFVGNVHKINNTSLPPEELSIGDRVAIKVIHRELMNNASVLKRGYRESLIKVRNKHLILMLDFINLNNTHHIISKFIQGKTLSKILNEGNRKGLGEVKSLDIIKQVLNGLACLHENEIIHRDIKPSNVCVTAEGRAIIMDLGVAKVSDGKRLSVTGVGSILGTPHYSSPEQVLGETDKVSYSSDIYSLGITLFEMLTGHSPFQSESEWEVIKMQVKEPLPDDTQINEKLYKIILKTTEKDSNNRYQKAEHVIQDLEYYQNPPKGIVNKIKRLFNRFKR